MSVLKKRSRPPRGFLLFELMVAVIVLSVSLAIISRAFIHSLVALKTSAQFFKGGLLLENKMWELEQKKGVSPEKEEGTFEELGGGFRWIVETKEMETPLYETLVTVGWNTGNRAETLQVTTYLPKPHEK